MQPYHELVSNKNVPQSQPINTQQVLNAAGGYAYNVDDWEQLNRFLLIGTVGGTYYIDERKLTKQNLDAVHRCIATDPARVLMRLVEVSINGLALENDPALFVLALVAVTSSRKAAFDVLASVARIPTHLFTWLTYYKAVGGKSNRAFRSAVANWYTAKDSMGLAYHLTKYQQRDGWSNADAIRLSHPKPKNKTQEWLFSESLGKFKEHQELVDVDVYAYMKAIQLLHSDSVALTEKMNAIMNFKLTREVVPTELLNHAIVWDALLESMPMHAVVRNLAKMTAVGLLAPMTAATSQVIAKLGNEKDLAKSKMHPLALFIALQTYDRGAGIKGKLSWTPNQHILAALDLAIYKSFKNVQPIGKRMLVSLDISSSMSVPAGGEQFTCAEAGAALLTVLGNTEPLVETMTFDTGARLLNVKGRSIRDVNVDAHRWGGGTDLSQTFLHATQHSIPVDVFVILTDNETWAGRQHPEVALEVYRTKMKINSKVVLVSMAANQTTVGNPNDTGVLNVVGFDASLPQIIKAFVG